MLHRSDVLKPDQNLDLRQHFAAEVPDAAEGVYLDELPLGAVVHVETGHHTYQLENRGDGRAMIHGHPKYCPEPVLVELFGATSGGAMLKMRFIGVGLRMEFLHPTLGMISTSRVVAIHELRPA